LILIACSIGGAYRWVDKIHIALLLWVITIGLYGAILSYYSSGHTSSPYLKRLRYFIHWSQSGRELRAIRKPPNSCVHTHHTK
jgi:uncharacterized membrane protein YfcA